MPSRTTFVVFAGLFLKCLTQESPDTSSSEDAVEFRSLELQDRRLLVAELEDLDTHEQKVMARRLRQCSNSVDKQGLDHGQKLILAACIAPSLNGHTSPEAIAEKYNMCVARENGTETAKYVAEQTAECITQMELHRL